MINWCIAYGIIVGFLFRFLAHNRLVVAGGPGASVLQWLGGVWVRGTLISLLIVLQIRNHNMIPESYGMWWDWYFVEHSKVAWFLITCGITLALYAAYVVTYLTAKDPHGYQLYDEKTAAPSILRTSMKTPLMWYAIFWGWFLLSPWLPFFKCFIQVYLLRMDPTSVFAAG